MKSAAAESSSGSVSYIAPEYKMGSEASTYGDVYSFGILLLELFTGKKPSDKFRNGLNLRNFVATNFLYGVAEIADSRLLENDNLPSKCRAKLAIEGCLRLIFIIGFVCSSESPIDRIDMGYAVSKLQSIRDDFLIRLHYSQTEGVRSRSYSSCMDNGSLELWLHPSTGTEDVRDAPKNLSLIQRLEIAIDVACALDFLHNHHPTPIVHCDINPSNVLLDKELIGHVSDTKFTGVIRSVGYTAPEYRRGSEVSRYGDVYSFGILLLEMFTGKRPTDHMFSVNGLNLRGFVEMAILERVTEIADSRLLLQRGTNDTRLIEECLISIFRIGIACSARGPWDRMNINRVVPKLLFIRDRLLA
ncbi:hypothetical protein M0R45_034346 [Rubus argutus]|uniref:non-specific serine/threonine protein kinase n=1 Tax=Rubus argutus TaxID=59490 RepID=A0AAW1VQU8_RUBAR